MRLKRIYFRLSSFIFSTTSSCHHQQQHYNKLQEPSSSHCHQQQWQQRNDYIFRLFALQKLSIQKSEKTIYDERYSREYRLFCISHRLQNISTAGCGRRTKPTNRPGKSPASNILPLPFIRVEISSVCTIIVPHRLLRIKK